MKIKRTDIEIKGQAGQLEVRLAESEVERAAAQRLRYDVFYKEMSAAHGNKSSNPRMVGEYDSDIYDTFCDHLIVVDKAADNKHSGLDGRIIGTYRLLREDVACRHNGFYTQAEFNIEALIARHSGRRFLELGRSCVLKEYRTKRTIELLWHGIWAYCLHHRLDVMFGCASFEGTNKNTLIQELTFLRQVQIPPREWQAKAHPDRLIRLNGETEPVYSPKDTLKRLPPLIKAYLRLGAYICEDAVIDDDFGTIDVLIVLPIENINPRYIHYYGEDAGRHAA